MVLQDIGASGRQAARQKALEARTKRAEIKQKFTSGQITLAQVFDLADENDSIARMRCLDLLTSTKGIGQIRAAKVMEELGIAANRRLRGLGRRQREALIAWHTARLAAPATE